MVLRETIHVANQGLRSKRDPANHQQHLVKILARHCDNPAPAEIVSNFSDGTSTMFLTLFIGCSESVLTERTW